MTRYGAKVVRFNIKKNGNNIMKITLRTILPITAAGMITLTSCGNSVNGRVQDYAILRHKSYGQCHNILKKNNLIFGAFDFIFDPDDNWFFLEFNPNGQWLWLEKILGVNISGNIIKYLSGIR